MTPETDPSADLQLIRAAQSGDDSAFEKLVDRHSGSLYGLAYFLIGEAASAEDVVQETFLGAYEALEQFEARASVKTWLTRILVNQAAKHRRAERVRKTQPLHLSTASAEILKGSSSAAASEIRMDVLEVLKWLAPEHREIVVLRELKGMSYQEISDVLNIPAGTVESRLFRARQELKELLKDYIP